jgi:hypothetical protein
MIIKKLKTSKPIPFDKEFKEPIFFKFENISVLELNDFTAELTTKRNNLQDFTEISLINLNSHKNDLKIYLSLLKKLNAMNIEFINEIQWLDTTSGEYIKSKNLLFEYFNILFNLATCLYLSGCYFIEEATDTAKLKEGIKNFQHASFYYERLIKEVPCNLFEIPIDMSFSYLNFVKYINNR